MHLAKFADAAAPLARAADPMPRWLRPRDDDDDDDNDDDDDDGGDDDGDDRARGRRRWTTTTTMTTCAICMARPRGPVGELPGCGHVFCHRCITRWAHSRAHESAAAAAAERTSYGGGDAEVVDCPVCRVPFAGATAIRRRRTAHDETAAFAGAYADHEVGRRETARGGVLKH